MVDNLFGPIKRGAAGQPTAPQPASIQSLSDQMAANAWRKRTKLASAMRFLPTVLDLPSNYVQFENDKGDVVWQRMPDEDATTIKVIRMPLAMLFETGRIPDAITPLVLSFIETLESKDPDANQDKVMKEFEEDPEATYNRWLTMLRAVWMGTVVWPTFVMDEAEADEEKLIFPITDVDYMDLLYVYTFTQGVDQAVTEFLQLQDALVGAMGADPSILNNAGKTLRIERRGGAVARVPDQPGSVALGSVHRVEGGSDEGSSDADRHGPADDDGSEVQS